MNEKAKIKECKECGNEFTQKTTNQIFCCDGCRNNNILSKRNFTNTDIIFIREAYSGDNKQLLAIHFNTSIATITNIYRRNLYKDVL